MDITDKRQLEEGEPLKQKDVDIYTPVTLQEGNKTKQYLAAIITTIGAFNIGTALAWSSPALPFLRSNSTFLEEPLDPDQEAWVGSLVAVGAAIGAIPTGYIADSIGRKWTIIGLTIPFILSWAFIVFGKSLALIYWARILAGLSTGGLSVASPMYIGEIAEVSVRGALGSYFEVLICAGVSVVYMVGAVTDYVWLGVAMGIPTVVYLVLFLFMPETPTYLLEKGDVAGAKSVLQYFRGVDCCVDPELKLMQQELQEARSNSASWKDLLSSKVNIKALLIGIGLQCCQQLSGVNIVIFYTSDLFTEAGSTLDPNICSIIVGVIQVFATYISLMLVDKAGRRMLLLVSGIPSFFCLFTLGIYFYIKEQDPELAESINFIPLITVTIFLISMALGYGPIPWMMLGELFTTSFKGIAASTCCIINWLLVFLVTKTYPNLLSLMGTSGCFWFYSVLTFLLIIFVYFKVPETKGKTFLEIQNMLAKK